MAKIQSGNWNDLPWMPNHKRDVNGKVTCKIKCFGMECNNLVYCMSEMENGMPIEEQTQKHEFVVMCLKGEVDYVVNGVPYRLTPGSWVNVPPYSVHYAHVYRSPEPCQIIESFTPSRPQIAEEYKAFLLSNYGIKWEVGGTEVKDLTSSIKPETLID